MATVDLQPKCSTSSFTREPPWQHHLLRNDTSIVTSSVFIIFNQHKSAAESTTFVNTIGHHHRSHIHPEFSVLVRTCDTHCAARHQRSHWSNQICTGNALSLQLTLRHHAPVRI
ncbi:hypothetical protein DEO72_LG8g1911 [Vigna unguiculata]|uniref:Uncharacterized protein n=1 Tax=Vigna unguiculata TaxID=3917 RepID=A0A4D6MTD1_VIGUN|nr:hypothetical protein DEO72_LG8g1911 [Vigna unguiculata]